MTYMWEEINSAAPIGYSTELYLNYNAFSTANFSAGSNALSTGGATCAFRLLVCQLHAGRCRRIGDRISYTQRPSFGLYPLSETGGRYHPIAPYFRDSYKITPKLTIDYGLRWDYLPPFHEVKDRWTFLNPNLTNPLTSPPACCSSPATTAALASAADAELLFPPTGRTSARASALPGRSTTRPSFAPVSQLSSRRLAASVDEAETPPAPARPASTFLQLAPLEVGTGATAGPSYYLNNSQQRNQPGEHRHLHLSWQLPYRRNPWRRRN